MTDGGCEGDDPHAHVVEEDYIFLKTIIPSRKATRAYMKEQED